MAFKAQPFHTPKAGETYTAEKANQLWGERIDATTFTVAVVSGMDQTNMASGAGLVVNSTTSPSDTDTIWYDPDVDMYHIYNGSSWIPQRGLILTNGTGGTINRGDVCVVSTAADSTAIFAGSARDIHLPMVAAESIANTATGRFWVYGKAVVNTATLRS